MEKSSVFIGSSKEGGQIAEKIRQALSEAADCTLWCGSFFELNVSTFDNLCKKAVMFDFAILVATKDDKALIRKKQYPVMRDNVLFEYGLFTGTIGRKRTFVLLERGVRIPSDWAGITTSFFENENDLSVFCGQMKRKILEECAMSRISLLPSTSSAIGYYTNFLQPLCAVLQREKEIDVAGTRYPFVAGRNRIVILVPPQLQTDLKARMERLTEQHGLQNVTVPVLHGTLRAYAAFSAEEGRLHIVDLPLCLSTSKIAVGLFFGQDFLGRPEQFVQCEQREISNFFNTLQNLVQENAYASNVVDFVRESQLAVGKNAAVLM